MKLRFYIFGLLLLSYSVIPGHEVIYGHHTSADVNCHHSSSDCCHHHDDNSGHQPCLLDINPHMVSSNNELIATHFEIVSPKFYAILSLRIDMLDVAEFGDPQPPGFFDTNIYKSPMARSFSLRGPPLA